MVRALVLLNLLLAVLGVAWLLAGGADASTSPLPAAPFVLDYPPAETEWVALGSALALAGIYLVCLRRSSASRLRGPSAILVALLAAVVLLASLEGILRIHEGLRPGLGHRPLPNLIWLLPPNLRDVSFRSPMGTTTRVSTNELGLRESEVGLPRAEGEFRILCVGDSWTFGQGVDAQKTWCKRLQALLRKRCPGQRVTVVNAGVQGFSFFQGYHLLRQILPLYRPDVVILGPFNEFGNAQIPEMEEALETDAHGLAAVLRGSRIYEILRKEVGRLASAAQPPRSAAAAVERAIDNPGVVRLMSETASIRYLQGMVELSRRRGARCVAFMHRFEPTPASGQPAFHRSSTHPVLSRLPAQPGLAVVDVCFDRGRHYMQDKDPWHPDEAGHDAMAQALAGALEEAGMAPCPP